MFDKLLKPRLDDLHTLYSHRSLITLLISQMKGVLRHKNLGIGELFTFEKLRKFKTSDTLFVMGSGPSINQLTAQQLDLIKSRDSFGFTNWTLHSLVPTFYMNEFKDRSEELKVCGQQELENLIARQSDYQNTAIILRANKTRLDDVRRFSELGFPFDNVFFSLDIPVLGHDEHTFHNSIKFLSRFGLVDSNFLMLNKTASLFRIIYFAYRMKYTDVVLCGVDLTGDRYFWDDEPEFFLKRGLRLPVLTEARGKIHKTNHPDFACGSLTISEGIKHLNNSLLKDNLSLWVSSESSGLSSSIKTYPPWHVS